MHHRPGAAKGTAVSLRWCDVGHIEFQCVKPNEGATLVVDAADLDAEFDAVPSPDLVRERYHGLSWCLSLPTCFRESIGVEVEESGLDHARGVHTSLVSPRRRGHSITGQGKFTDKGGNLWAQAVIN